MAMTVTRRLSVRVVMTVLSALPIAGVLIPVMAGPVAAQSTTPVPVCAGAKDLLVDVTQDVLNQPFFPAKDGHMWANFAYNQRLRVYAVGAHMYCLRKDYVGTWVSVAGLSPGLTGTVSGGLTGTFTDTTYWEWTGTLRPLRPTTGYLGVVDAGCTDVDVCADFSYLIGDTFYFPDGALHCNSIRRDLEVDGGAHGHISFIIDGDPNRVSASGDITG